MSNVKYSFPNSDKAWQFYRTLVYNFPPVYGVGYPSLKPNKADGFTVAVDSQHTNRADIVYAKLNGEKPYRKPVWITKPSRDTFSVWHKPENATAHLDAMRSRGAVINAWEVWDASAYPLSDIIGRLGDCWYVRRD